MRTAPTVLHLDADAFFASVEQRQRPSLRGRPVVVGGLGPRGVVATASYEARPFGVHSAQSMAQARSRCPHAVFLTPRFAAYSAHSSQIMAVLRELSPLVEPVSMDEAYVDLASGPHAADPRKAGEYARAQIYARTGLSVSVGLGRSKLIAKLASEADKPHGFRLVDSAAEDAFLLAHPVGALSGVGPVTRDALARLGIRTVADLRAVDERTLTRAVGAASGQWLYRLARGEDARPVVPDREAKSVSSERTFDTDVWPAQLPAALGPVLDGALGRLRRAGAAARTVTVKVRLANFVTLSRAVSIPQPSADPVVLTEAALRALTAAQVSGPVRLLGVGFSALSSFEQLVLGTDTGERPEVTRPETGAPTVGEGSGAEGDVRVPLTPENCRPGVDVEHAEFGRGWVTDRDGAWVRVRFEGPDTPPASRDRTFDARLGALHVTEPPAPSGPHG